MLIDQVNLVKLKEELQTKLKSIKKDKTKVDEQEYLQKEIRRVYRQKNKEEINMRRAVLRKKKLENKKLLDN